MDNYTIFTKTAKGLGEALGKTKNLSRDHRKILKEIDGKASFDNLVEQTGIEEARLGPVISKLLAEDYIREFGSAAPPGAQGTGETVFGLTVPAKIEVANSQLTIGDFFRAMEKPQMASGSDVASLDFKNLGITDADSARKAREEQVAQIEQTRRAIEDEARRITEQMQQQAAEAVRRETERQASAAAEKARVEAEAARQQAMVQEQARARQEAEEQARRAAEERARKEAEEAQRQARIKAEQEARWLAEEAARHNEQERQRREAEERARQQAEEARKRAEAERQVRLKAEEEARRAAEEQAKKQAEEQARLKAEKEARFKAEEEARLEAEARARREAEERERARLQAEEDARLAAEARAREEAEAQARREAEEVARRQEEEARRKAEEEAQKQAQEQARAKAWEAARRAAEELAKREAEAQAKAEAERQARLKAEEEARLAAEEQARLKAEEDARRAAEEQARRQAEERARLQAEEEARRVAEEKARREAEEQAKKEARERAKREAEEAARMKAEQKAREKAEAKARKEMEAQAKRTAREQARRDAEEKARQEAERKAQLAAEAKATKEAEEQAKREAREKTRQAAEEAARQKAEEVARQKAEKEAEKAAAIAAKAAAIAGAGADSAAEVPGSPDQADTIQPATAGAAPASGGGVRIALPFSLGKLVRFGAMALASLSIAGLAAVHVMPFNARLAQLQKEASAQFGQPVRIGNLNLALFPQPHWRLQEVTIGDDKQIVIPQVKAGTSIGSLLAGGMQFNAVELVSPAIDEEGLGWIIFGTSSGEAWQAASFNASDIRLRTQQVTLPAFDGNVEFDERSGWRKIALNAAAEKLHIDLHRKDGALQFEVTANDLVLPFGATRGFDSFNASGTMARDGLEIDKFTGVVYDGTLSGNAVLRWKQGWSLKGEAQARQFMPAKLVPTLVQGGALDGNIKFTMQSDEVARLFAAPQARGSFSASNGSLLGIDMTSQIMGQAGSGKTAFNAINGDFYLDGGKLKLSRVHMAAGLLSAAGEAAMDADGKLSGQFSMDLRTATRQAHGSLRLGGTAEAPQFGR